MVSTVPGDIPKGPGISQKSGSYRSALPCLANAGVWLDNDLGPIPVYFRAHPEDGRDQRREFDLAASVEPPYPRDALDAYRFEQLSNGRPATSASSSYPGGSRSREVRALLSVQLCPEPVGPGSLTVFLPPAATPRSTATSGVGRGQRLQ